MDWEISPEMQERLDKLDVREQAVEKRVDVVSQKIAQRFGYAQVPWFKLTWYLLWVYTGLTCLIMFKREDFMDLTICVVALYMLFNTDRITRFIFRLLVLCIIVSLLYDILWFVVKHYEYTSTGGTEEGGNEIKIRQFVLLVSYVTFILKVLYLILLYIYK